jgi:hypothetical protein
MEIEVHGKVTNLMGGYWRLFIRVGYICMAWRVEIFSHFLK